MVSERITAIENITYKKTTERDLKADVYLPESTTTEKFPAVLLIHGGGWLTGSKENERVMAQHLAKNGYVAITASYRLGTEAKYPAGMDDLQDALKWFRHIKPVKPHLLRVTFLMPKTSIRSSWL